MHHPITWYVVADGGRARILHRRDGHDIFDTERELVSSELHKLSHDLGTDRPGRGHESANVSRHAVEPRQDLHRAEKRSFAEEVARTLNESSAQDAFDRLILVAPAHALEDLNDGLDAATRRKVAAELQKDLTHVPNAALADHFAGLDD